MNARIFALSLTVCAAACRTAAGPAASAPIPAATPVVVRTNAAAIAKARADSVRLPWTAADARFMSGMIGHHAQALDMARLVPSRTNNGSIRTLAARITNAQQDEIVTMQQWLADRQLPIPEAKAAGMKMMMDGHEHVMLMPGMLTEEQMKQLEAARGRNFDELFLTFMMQHHRGALSMVKELFGTPGAGQDETVFKFASDVNVDQETEIARMEQMLASIKQGK